MMEYKGYTGEAEVCVEDGILFGRVTNIRDVVTFQSETIGGLEREFQISVDEYLRACRELGQEPNRPFDGVLDLRVPQKLQERIVRTAESDGKTVSDWVRDRLDEAALPLHVFDRPLAISAAVGDEEEAMAASA